MLNNLVWKQDRMLLNDLVFRLQHYRNDSWELGDDCFLFFKIKPLIDQYERFWATRPHFRPESILELGMWDGGSLAFWHEIFQPKTSVGIDFARRSDSVYFQRYLEANKLGGRVKSYWGVDQADGSRLRTIVKDDFASRLDLVFDDASHEYELSKASFNILFPYLRPGGLYVLEDWAWAHWREFHTPERYASTPLTQLVSALVEATGSSTALISSLAVYQGFVVVERGELEITNPAEFSLDAHVTRWPYDSRVRRSFAHFMTARERVMRRLRQAAGR